MTAIFCKYCCYKSVVVATAIKVPVFVEALAKPDDVQ
jgi:hypothetical protein